jgi:hypothetical protein
MATLSKAVSNRKGFAEHVVTTINIHAPACIAEAESQLTVENNPEKSVDLNKLLNALSFNLTRATVSMTDKDLFVGEELADDPYYRDLRDKKIGELRSENMDLRNLLSSVYGVSILSVYGLSGETPSNYDQLITSSKNTINLMQKSPLPVPLKKGISSLDSALLIESLSEKVDELQSALSNVKIEEKELELAVRNREISIEAWQKIFSATATITAEILKLGGRNDLADRVRPTAHKVSGSEEPPVVQAASSTVAEG